MFTKEQSRIVIILGLLGVLSCIFSFFQLSEIPTLDFKFPLSKQEIFNKADSFLDLQGYSTQPLIKKSKVISSKNNIIYLQRILRIEKTNRFLESLPLYYWQIDYVYSLDRKFIFPSRKPKELTRVFISPISGKIIGFSRLVPQEDYNYTRTLSRRESEAIAYDFFRLIGFDISNFRMSSYSPTERKNVFEWERVISDFALAKLNVKLDILGNEVSNFYYFLEISPRELKKIKSSNILTSLLFIVLNVSVIILGIFVLVFSIRKRKKLEWKFGLPFALLILLSSIINFFNLGDYKGFFLNTFLFVSILSVTIYFFWTILVSCMAKLFAKESDLNMFPIRVSFSIILSYVFIFVGLGFTMLAFVFVQKIFNPVSTLGFYSFFSRFPSFRLSCLIAPFLSLTAAVSEELFFRALMISFLKKYLKRTVWAIVLSSLIWSFIHVSPQGYGDIYPDFIKGIILLPIGVLFGYIFVKFGLMCAIATHFLHNLVVIGASYLEFSNFRYAYENIITMLIFAILPLAIAFYFKIKEDNE